MEDVHTRTGRRRILSAAATTWEQLGEKKKKKKTKAEMDRLREIRHESHRSSGGGCPRQNWLEENCVCRSDNVGTARREEEEEEDQSRDG